MITLTADIGNSRVKLDFWDNDGVMFQEVYDTVPIDRITEMTQNYFIEGIIVSSVKNGTERLVEEIKKESGCKVVVNFNQEEIKKLGDQIKYEGPIGPDRIAAFLGAKAQIGKVPMLIIDAGTAITLDIADKEGNFCGGNISLGIEARKKALAAATDRLPVVKNYPKYYVFGVDTFSAIEAGARNGVIGEVLYTVELAKLKYDIKWIVVGGGDIHSIYRYISDEWEKCIPDEHLVGRGLNYHLRKFYFPSDFRSTKFQQSI